jgi:hypothetical protein
MPVHEKGAEGEVLSVLRQVRSAAGAPRFSSTPKNPIRSAISHERGQYPAKAKCLTMTRTFEITDEMIRGGSPKSDTNCPIGLALQAAGITPICVGFNFISCVVEGRIHNLPMPREASTFLQSHDAAKAVRPTRFRLTFLDEPRRPLPARLRRRSMPKAPPLPGPLGAHRLTRFRKTLTNLVSLFAF